MLRSAGITLISESPEVKGVFDTKTDSEREVFCTVRSVGMQESYIARGQGFAPEYVFQLTQSFEYQGEKRLKYHDVE